MRRLGLWLATAGMVLRGLLPAGFMPMPAAGTAAGGSALIGICYASPLGEALAARSARADALEDDALPPLPMCRGTARVSESGSVAPAAVPNAAHNHPDDADRCPYTATTQGAAVPAPPALSLPHGRTVIGGPASSADPFLDPPLRPPVRGPPCYPIRSPRNG